MSHLQKITRKYEWLTNASIQCTRMRQSKKGSRNLRWNRNKESKTKGKQRKQNYQTKESYKCIKKRTQKIEWSTSACFFCWHKTMHNQWWHDDCLRKLNNFTGNYLLLSLCSALFLWNVFLLLNWVYNEGVCMFCWAHTKTSKICSALYTIKYIMMPFYTSRTMLYNSSPVVLALFVASHTKTINKLLRLTTWCEHLSSYIIKLVIVHT